MILSEAFLGIRFSLWTTVDLSWINVSAMKNRTCLMEPAAPAPLLGSLGGNQHVVLLQSHPCLFSVLFFSVCIPAFCFWKQLSVSTSRIAGSSPGRRRWLDGGDAMDGNRTRLDFYRLSGKWMQGNTGEPLWFSWSYTFVFFFQDSSNSGNIHTGKTQVFCSFSLHRHGKQVYYTD